MDKKYSNINPVLDPPVRSTECLKVPNPSGRSAKALDTQVGGGHYKCMAIQPVEYILKNGLGYCEGNIVKYASRHKSKGGVEDVRKIIHYAQLLIELEYPEGD